MQKKLQKLPLRRKLWLYNLHRMKRLEKKPTYIGGDSALNVFIANNVQYPAEAKKNKEQGEVTVQFVIDEKGAIKDAKVLTSVSTTLDC